MQRRSFARLVDQSNVGTGFDQTQTEIFVLDGFETRVDEIGRAVVRSIVHVGAHLEQELHARSMPLARFDQAVVNCI